MTDVLMCILYICVLSLLFRSSSHASLSSEFERIHSEKVNRKKLILLHSANAELSSVPILSLN